MNDDLEYLLVCVEQHADKFPVPSHMLQRVANIRHALSRPGADGEAVAVKPLEWQRPLGNERLLCAETLVGIYRVWTHFEAKGQWFWALSDGPHPIKASDCASENAGKAAAQADYEARIRSALAAPPSPVTEAIRKALSVLTFPVAEEINPRRYAIRTDDDTVSYACEILTAALSTATAAGWNFEDPEKDGFYWVYQRVPPQSHPMQAAQFRKDRGWLSSWPVLAWRDLPAAPSPETEG